MPAAVLEQPSIAFPAPVLHSSRPSSVCSTAQIEEMDDSYDAYDDCEQSPNMSSSASMPQISSLSALPQKRLALSHRRANTEVIPRQSRSLSAGQDFADRARTLEDLGDNRRLSQPPPENSTKKIFGDGARLLADWFQGKSEPMSFGAFRLSDSEESDEMASNPDDNYQGSRSPRESSHFSRPSTALSSSSRAQKRSSPLKQVTTASRFSFFGLKRQDQSILELPEPADDEFLNMDINAVLYPPRLNNMDPDEALDVVRNNANSALRRLQAAYKQRTFALHEYTAEKNEIQEDMEESRTLAGHLKTQLDGMAEKALQQEKAMKVMAEELDQERQMRQKEEEARKRTVALVKAADSDSISELGADLQAPKKNFKRSSNCTFASDSGFESGDESIAESVFSRRDGLESPVSLTLPSPNLSQAAGPVSTVQASQRESRVSAVRPQRQSAYDRVIKGIASSSLANSLMGHSSKCTVCHGVPASEAWTVLGILKEENHGLKERITELGNAVDDCLCVLGP